MQWLAGEPSPGRRTARAPRRPGSTSTSSPPMTPDMRRRIALTRRRRCPDGVRQPPRIRPMSAFERVDDMRSAAVPRWRGKAGRLEVWYATLSDPLTRAGLWIHCETVAPTHAADLPYAHGWASWFPPDGPPRTERFGPEPAQPVNGGGSWFDAAGVRVGPGGLTGRAGSLAWELSWTDSGAPLWTFPRMAWERELLPAAQVVVAPTADFTGSLTVGDDTHRVDDWRGARRPHLWARQRAALGVDPCRPRRRRRRRSGRGGVTQTGSASTSALGLRSPPASTERIGPQALCPHCGCGPRLACRVGS